MGKVNVVRYDGTVVSVDEDLAKAAEGSGGLVRGESVGEEQQRGAKENLAKRPGAEILAGPAGSAVASILSAGDTASFGLLGRAANAILSTDDTGKTQFQELLQEHPTATTAGSVAGVVADPFGAFAGVGTGARALLKSRVAARAVEGATFGVGSHIATTNVTGDPLTIEGTLEAAGLGSVINVGIGMLGDGLTSAGWNARKKIAENAIAADELQKGSKLLKEGTPQWDNFVEAYKGEQTLAKKIASDAERSQKTYNSFVNSNQKLTGVIRSAESAVNEISGRYTPLGAPTTFTTTEGMEMVQGALTRPPISAELADRLQEYRQRISEIYKLKGGGWNVDVNNKWVRDPSAPANTVAAAEKLRTLQDDLQQQFPKAAGRLKDLPPPPLSTPPPLSAQVKLPETMGGFAAMRPDTIQRLGTQLGNESSAAIEKVAADLGVATGQSSAETLAGIHARLGDYVSALAKKEAEQQTGLVAWARSAAKNAAANVVGYSAYGAVGGLPGVALAAASRSTTRTVMGGVEDAVLGGTLAAGKKSIRDKIRDLVGKYAEPAGQAITDSGPVLSVLGNSFLTGEKDPEKDPRAQALNRAKEVLTAANVAPDASYKFVSPMMGHPADLAMKFHSAITNALGFLAMKAPKDSGLAMKMFESQWTPTWKDTLEFAHTLEAALRPMDAIRRALHGDGHPAASDTLWNIYPATMAEFAGEVAFNGPQLAAASFGKAAGFTALTRTPLGFQNPAISLRLQGMYVQQAVKEPPQSQPTGNPVGRPPAVNQRSGDYTMTQRLSN